MGNGFSVLDVKPTGDIAWKKLYSQTNGSVDTVTNIVAAVQAKSGGFIAVGVSTVDTPYYVGTTEPILAKIDTNGKVIWKKTMGNDQSPNCIAAAQGGNYLVAGGIYDTSGGIPYLTEIDDNGGVVWKYTYFFNSLSPAWGAEAFVQTQDGNLFIVGTCTNFARGDTICGFLLKTNSEGDTLWTRTYANKNTSQPQYFSSILATSDGNFLIAGSTVLKVTPNGDILWENDVFGRGDEFSALFACNDGNFLCVGAYSPKVSKFTPDGDILWSLPEQNAYASYWNPVGIPTIVALSAGNLVVEVPGIWRYAPPYTYTPLVFSIIDDRYAFKNTPFTFKIPGADDSLLRTYTPVKTPAGMTVSKGGTISWTPQTDSVYAEHVAYFITKDTTVKDSLTFNIFVNSKTAIASVNRPLGDDSRLTEDNIIKTTVFPGSVLFSLKIKTSSIGIYDIFGRLVARLPVVNNAAVWRGTIAAGRYFVKPLDGKQGMVKGFFVAR
jgi:hypothetical protein